MKGESPQIVIFGCALALVFMAVYLWYQSSTTVIKPDIKFSEALIYCGNDADTDLCNNAILQFADKGEDTKVKILLEQYLQLHKKPLKITKKQ